MIFKKVFISLFFTIALLVFSKGQDLLFNIQFYNQEDGLSDRSIFCVSQDDRGIIWIGTGNGLNKFDGSQFSKVKQKESSIASGSITRLKKKNSGLFWIQKENESAVVFDPLKEDVSFLDDSTFNSKRLQIFFNVEFKDGCLAKDDNQRLYYLNDKGQILPIGDLKYEVKVNQLAAGKKGILLGGKEQGIVEIDFSGDTIYQNNKLHWATRIAQPPGVEVVLPALEEFKSSRQRTWLVKDLIFEKINNSAPIPLELKISGKPLKTESVIYNYSYHVRVIKDFEGRFWVVSQNHVLLFDTEGNFLSDLSSELSRFSDLSWTANDLFIDRDNRLWIASGLGLFVIQVQHDPFQKYQGAQEVWSTRHILELPDNQLLVCTYHGIKILDRTSGVLVDSFPYFGFAGTMIHPDTVFIGSHGSALMKYLPKSRELITEKANINYSQVVAARIPFYDQESGTLYLGTSAGLFSQIQSKDSTWFEKKESADFPEMDHSTVKCFYRNKEGLWIGTNKGIFLYQPATGFVAHVTFPFNDIKYIHEDQKGDFWVATNGGGLIHWNRTNDNKKQYTTDDGLSHDVIYAVYEDAKGELWLPSNNGLMRFNKQTEETIVFLPKDGITNKEFNTFSHYQAPDGRLYFGGLDGVIAFYPQEIVVSKSEAPLLLTGLKVFDGVKNRLVDYTPNIPEIQKLQLSPNDKFFILNFAFLDYSTEVKNYAWRLNDEDWNHQISNNIRINKLNYGQHQLEIRAKGAGGQWASQKIMLPIVVFKPFYLQSSFLFLTALVLTLLIMGFIRWRTANLKKQAEALSLEVFQRTQVIRTQKNQLEEANHFKDKILTLVAHDLRSPLLTLSGLAQKINFLIEKERVEDVKRLSATVADSVEGATNLLDNIMNWALLQRDQVKMMPVKVSLNEAVQEAIQLYQKAAEQKQISIIPPKKEAVAFVDPTALQTILRNLLQNSIKFTPRQGQVSLVLDELEDQVQIKVCDNGVGIPPNWLDRIFMLDRDRKTKGTEGEKGTGIGLSLVKELVDRNHGSIRVESEPGRGTTFICRLPAGR